VWYLQSSLTQENVKGKIVAAFGTYGRSGEPVGLLEDRLRGLNMRVPVKGQRVKLNPTDGDLDTCRELGRELAGQLTGAARRRVIDMSELV
jgi:flavorubredoxin